MSSSQELRVGTEFALQKKKLGKGSFGSIYQGRNISTSEKVAIKLVCSLQYIYIFFLLRY